MYVYYVYINTDTCVYLYLYIIYIIYKYLICKSNMFSLMCVFIYTHNKYTQYTHSKQTFILNVINLFSALVFIQLMKVLYKTVMYSVIICSSDVASFSFLETQAQRKCVVAFICIQLVNTNFQAFFVDFSHSGKSKYLNGISCSWWPSTSFPLSVVPLNLGCDGI